MLAERGGGVEERAAAGGDFGEYAARHDVARREFGERMPRQHEALAACR